MKRFRLYLYDPLDDAQPLVRTGRVYRDTQADQAEMLAVIREYNRMSWRRADTVLCMGIFPLSKRGRAKKSR